MEKKAMNKMIWAAVLGGMGVAGYMYFKKNPNAMSNTIINTKPIANPIVPMSECSPSCASGINSSITT